MGKKGGDDGGWETVKAPKQVLYMQRKQQEARAEAAALREVAEAGKLACTDVTGAEQKRLKPQKVDKFKQAAAECLPQFDALAAAATDPASRFSVGGKGKKKEAAAVPPPEPEAAPAKKVQTEAEKQAARKERRKQKAKEQKEQEKSVPKEVFADKLVARVPAKIMEQLRELPGRYKGQLRDQLRLVPEFLDMYLPPGAVLCQNYKGLPFEERVKLPLASHDGGLTAVVNPMFDAAAAEEPRALFSSLRGNTTMAFGRTQGCSRVDDGKGCIGTRLYLQLLLAHRPEVLTDNLTEFEESFQRDAEGRIVPAALLNLAWVFMQVRSPACMPSLARAWAQHFLPHILAKEGTAEGPVVDAGYAVGALIGRHIGDLRDDDRRRWKNANQQADPVSPEELATALAASSPKKARLRTLIKNTLAPCGILYTAASPGKHYVRLMQLLLSCPDARELLLHLLTEAAVLDPSQKGCYKSWADSFLLLVRETSVLIGHWANRSKELSTRMSGPDLERLFEKLQLKCEDVLRGDVQGEAKKQLSKAAFEREDVEKVIQQLRRAQSLSRAKPEPGVGAGVGAGTAAPAAARPAKQQQQKGARRPAKKGGCCSWLLFCLVFAMLVVAATIVALPFLPPETQATVRRYGEPAVAWARAQAEQVVPLVKAQIERLSK
eukprot:TRINITY_DN4774_c1_g3_i1.p1 TRINITY_DN4774_c1_g3~~TRINITY_DN4774_c1_g3_i1.p1  ORF type:complete len:663 (+),score=284.59 TRINITY_DN4774_c1_g3_i1:101-2089(+)